MINCNSGKMHKVSTPVLSFIAFVLCSGGAFGGCPSLYTEIAGGCFLVVESAVDFDSARGICQSYNGDLAVVSDCALLGSLSEYLRAFYAGHDYWVGASDVASEGTWRWFDGTRVELGAPFWGRLNAGDYSTEPSRGTNENCALMATGAGFYFQDIPCSDETGHAPLCETAPDPTTGSCPGSYVHIGDSKCFQFLSTVDASWETARDICQSSGGDLAVIDDCQLMKLVIDFAKQSGSVPDYGFWIGGSDSASEGTWRWLGGSAMDMGATFWGRTRTGDLQPDDASNNEDCLVLWDEDRFLFNDKKCSNEYFALCQAEPWN